MDEERRYQIYLAEKYLKAETEVTQIGSNPSKLSYMNSLIFSLT